MVGGSSESGILKFTLSQAPDQIWTESFNSFGFSIGGGGLSSISGDTVGPEVAENHISWRSVHSGFIK